MKRQKLTAMKVKILFFLCFLAIITLSEGKEVWKPPKEFVKAKVLRVIDGDTVVVSIPEVKFNNRKKLKNLRFTVRLIGIDTPESRPNRRSKIQSEHTKKDIKTIIQLGKKAKEFTQSVLRKKGKKRLFRTVFLEFDVQPQDRYGRLLAYVWLPDGKMLNEIIICSGYAYPLTIPPNVKYKDRFLKCFREAREKQRGLWKK
ncbi:MULTISPECIES: thermonuclease family protein [Persephonella]|nr:MULTISPECIES: thermonuclease family protein [Persephonella]